MGDQFNYVMALVSIVIGLAITHVLGAFGAAIHRMRGHGRPIHLETVYLLWIAFVMLWVVSFWWWEFKFHELAVEWSYGLYLFVLGYATLLYLMVVVLVPKGMEGVEDSYDYFMAGRRWFFVVIIACNSVDVADSWAKSQEWALRGSYLLQVLVFYAGAVVGICSTSRRLQQWNAFILFLYQLVYTWNGLLVLGNW